MRSFLALLAVLALLQSPAAFAQAPAPDPAWPSAALLTEENSKIEALSAETTHLAEAINDDAAHDEKLVEIRLKLADVSAQAINSGVAFRERLDQINARVTQLGAAPAAGQPPEPSAVSDERQALLNEKASINALLGVAEQLSVQVDGLNERIANLRRDLFASQLFQRTPITPALVADVRENLQTEAVALGRTLASWSGFVIRFKLGSVLGACFLALLAATLMLVVGSRVFQRLLYRDPSNPAPSALDRLSTAFWSTLLPSLAVTVALGSTWVLFDTFEVLRGDIGDMLGSLFRVVSIVYFVHRLSRVALAPSLPNWRLVPVQSGAARLLVALISSTAVFNGLDFFLASIFRLRGAALSLTVAESFVATLGTGVLVALIGFVRPLADAHGLPRRWPVSVRLLFFALAALTILPALAGYIGFARFVSRQIVVTGALLGLMFIGVLLARAVSEPGAFAANKFGRALRARRGWDDAAMDRFALFLSFGINAAVVLIGVPMILLQWGFQPGDLRAWGAQAASGFQIGGFLFSPAAILGGVLVFALGWYLTAWFQRWLDGAVLERGRVDAGVRNSISLIVFYAGIALASLIAVSTAGIDLSSLALVAGALSLGIGFGLQNIVSNFVSGLILLAERPFKVGDWIVAGPVSGTVMKISVRATEIETFQRQTVILPNSELINSAVGNWTHRNRLGRVDLKFFLSLDADARRAHDLMMAAARAQPLVLKNPEPQVVFTAMSAAAFEMEVRVFMADILQQNAVMNDLRFAILEAFARERLPLVTAPRAAYEAPALPPLEPATGPSTGPAASDAATLRGKRLAAG